MRDDDRMLFGQVRTAHWTVHLGLAVERSGGRSTPRLLIPVPDPAVSNTGRAAPSHRRW